MKRTDVIAALVRGMIPAALADPFFRPPFPAVASDISSGLILYDDPSVTVSVAATSADALAAKKSGARGPSSITFSGLRTVFHFLKSGGVTLSFWEAPAITPGFTGDHGGRCRMIDRRRIEDGERVAIDGRTQSFVIEHVEADMLGMHAVVHTGAAPLSVEYDSRTHEFVAASSTDEAASRVQAMISVLRLMERTDAIPQFEELLRDSPHFYTRWRIMREFLALDAEAALPSLRRLAERDPHAEVRAAAARTLAMFFDQDAREPIICRA